LEILVIFHIEHVYFYENYAAFITGSLYGIINRWNTLKINRRDYPNGLPDIGDIPSDDTLVPDNTVEGPPVAIPRRELGIVLRGTVQRISI
jgi:hypothetical protein